MYFRQAVSVALVLCAATPLCLVSQTSVSHAGQAADATGTVTLDSAARSGALADLPHDIAPVAFTFSGAISLGAYEAGVNWVLIQFVRKSRDSAFRALARQLSQGDSLPMFEVASLAGASAGNINALLAAIEVCRGQSAADLTPRKSLFWRTWVGTGWEQLFPRRPQGSGLLDRQYFGTIEETIVRPALNLQSPSECDHSIPVGILVTKVTPDSSRIPYSVLVAPTQRHITIFRVDTAAHHFVFSAPGVAYYEHPELGLQLVPQQDSDGTFAPSSIFAVVTASAAYPLVWAPVRIAYHGPDCELRKRDDCNAIPQLFLDGGVFDNNPVGLAFDLARLDSQSVNAKPRTPMIIYVDPSQLRGAAESDATQQATEENENGLAGLNALTRFGMNFIPTARNYELQVFGRELTRSESDSLSLNAGPSVAAPRIMATTRAHAVVGEHLHAFAAFLGTPFREFDFYAGVADGLHFVSQSLVCRGIANPHLSIKRSCVSAMEDSLSKDLLARDVIGVAVVNRILEQNDPDLDLAEVPMPNGTADAASARLLLAVGESAQAASVAAAGRVCNAGDIVDKLLCSDGFDVLLDHLRNDASADSAIEKWGKRCETGPSRCGQEVMERLVNNPHNEMRQLLAQLLDRAREVESLQVQSGQGGHPDLIKGLEYGLYSTAHNTARQFLFDLSTVPARNEVANRPWYTPAYHLLPFYVGATVGAAGYVVGWEPGLRLDRTWTLALPVEITHSPQRIGPVPQYHFIASAAPSLLAQPGWFALSSVFAGPRFSARTYRGCPMFLCGDGASPVEHITPEGGVMLFGDKVRISAYRIPSKLAGRTAFPYAGSVSIADVNGLLYWLLR